MTNRPLHVRFSRTVLAFAVPLLLVACGGTGTDNPPGGSGVITGTLVMPQQISLDIQERPGSTFTFSADEPAPVVPGEVLVAFNRTLDLSTASISRLSVGGVQLTLQGGRDAAGYHHYVAEGLDQAGTLALVSELSEREDVAEAIPNWILSAYRVPNDEVAYLQWHYPMMNLPAAWDIETGQSNRITVAVVDSGGITDPNLHPDLSFVGGYNFVTEENNGGPNPGMSSDYMDYSHLSPEYPHGGAGFHGAHVAGTIGAKTENGVGLAGVNWSVDLVAVRSLGIDGSGSLASIYGGAWWAAGGQVEGVPANQHPARVINMSLGGNINGPCPDGIANMFREMAANGVITVVAAGNDNMNTATILPANCPGVITVGATDSTGSRAPYSNFGNDIDVMATGGNTMLGFTDTTTGNTYPAGVLSTVLIHDGGSAPLRPAMEFMQGTSMAAPHIAGIVSLMLARNPNLTFDEIVTQLRASGRPLTADGCVAGNFNVTNPATFCGTGIVDAAVAVGNVPAAPGPNPPGPNPPGPNPPGPNPPGPNPPPITPGPGQPIPTGNVYVAALFNNADGTFDPARSREVTLPASPGAQIAYALSGLAEGNYTVAAWQPLGTTDAIQRGDPFAMHPQPVSISGNQQVTNLVLYLMPFAGTAADAEESARLFMQRSE